jgi:hypothetical protein
VCLQREIIFPVFGSSGSTTGKVGFRLVIEGAVFQELDASKRREIRNRIGGGKVNLPQINQSLIGFKVFQGFYSKMLGNDICSSTYFL